MQKLQPFPYTNYILESCQRLEQLGEYRSDQYLRHIVQHQRLLEELEAAARECTPLAETTIIPMSDRMNSFKSQLTFPLSDCRKFAKAYPQVPEVVTDTQI
jgi:hypothetical protein